MTTSISGAPGPTVLPVWYCDPKSQSNPPACSCNPVKDKSCHQNHNALILLPAAAALAGLIPPPVGLAPIEIGPGGTEINSIHRPDGPEAPSSPAKPSPSPSAAPSSTPTDNDEPAFCTSPSLKANALNWKPATAPIITSTIPLPGHPFNLPSPEPTTSSTSTTSVSSAPLPVLPITALDDSWQSVSPNPSSRAKTCDPVVDPYQGGNFYQFVPQDTTMSRDDALNAINTFCNDESKNKTVIGPSGSVGADGKTKATQLVHKVIKGLKSGNIVVSISYDVESKAGKCPFSNYLIDFTQSNSLDAINKCKQFLGQVIDYCTLALRTTF